MRKREGGSPSTQDWFTKIFLVHRRRLQGKVILIGDNLRTHINLEIIRLCKEENIEFICLPPNITDKMQPLDVAVFGPMKRKWREELHKMRLEDPDMKALDKTKFPMNLKRLIEVSNVEQNLKAGFEKCGLFPLNEEKVMERLPQAVGGPVALAQHLDSQLIRQLETRRYGGKKKTGRGQKIRQANPTVPVPRERSQSQSRVV